MKKKYRVTIVSTGNETFVSATMIVITPSVGSAGLFVEKTLSSMGLNSFDITAVEWMEDVE